MSRRVSKRSQRRAAWLEAQRQRAIDEGLPPENSDFDRFPEAFQNVIAKRFERGIAGRERRDDIANSDAQWAQVEFHRRASRWRGDSALLTAKPRTGKVRKNVARSRP